MKGIQMTRRDMLKTAGLGSMAAIGSGMLPGEIKAAIDQSDEMRITKVEGITFGDSIVGNDGGEVSAEFMWVRLHTDSGVVGIGETYPFSNSELGALRDYARHIVGRDPRDIDGIWQRLYHMMAMRNAGGADMRILSAINMAQMDILGKVSGQPLYRLIGGKTRDRAKVYNTVTDYWPINNTRMGPDTEEIVRFLLDRGIKGMKIYPFNARDRYITPTEIDNGLEWFEQIRRVGGNEMEIYVDLWGRYDLASAKRIVKAIEPYDIMYIEDAMLMNTTEAYAELARSSSVPICHSETLATRYEYRPVLEANACDVIMCDISWCGGVTEAKKISDMADTYLIPISPHTAGGPLLWLSSIHLCQSIPNLMILESNYWKYNNQFPLFINNVPVPEDGYVRAPELPGIGAEIRPEIFSNGQTRVETIAEA